MGEQFTSNHFYPEYRALHSDARNLILYMYTTIKRPINVIEINTVLGIGNPEHKSLEPSLMVKPLVAKGYMDASQGYSLKDETKRNLERLAENGQIKLEEPPAEEETGFLVTNQFSQHYKKLVIDDPVMLEVLRLGVRSVEDIYNLVSKARIAAIRLKKNDRINRLLLFTDRYKALDTLYRLTIIFGYKPGDYESNDPEDFPRLLKEECAGLLTSMHIL